jgi:hypothetical protein
MLHWLHAEIGEPGWPGGRGAAVDARLRGRRRASEGLLDAMAPWGCVVRSRARAATGYVVGDSAQIANLLPKDNVRVASSGRSRTVPA